jgi:tRNA(Ile)-lysidine synthase TilS/MesJ
MAKVIHICKNCVLDSATPGISINESTGLCQFCEHFTPLSPEKKEEYGTRMDSLLKSPSKNGKYDVIFALSGGVDSSYMLYRITREYPRLNILAVQFDNGFISDTALENAQNFCALTKSTYMRLSLDPEALQAAFSKAANSFDAYPGAAKYRASDICNTCISIIKQKIIELAITTKAPYIIFAFSPGQTDAPFVTLSKPILLWMRKLFDQNLKAMGVIDREPYLIDAHHLQPGSHDHEVMMIHPFLIWDYNKTKFKKECIQQGWIDPNLKDQNSSNCLLNAFAIKNHLDKYHIHSYAYDLASLVRQGYMKREDALKKLTLQVPDTTDEEIKRKLKL